MEIRVKTLRDTLDLLAPVIPPKASIKSLGYVRLGDGLAVATDLEIAATFDLPDADEALLLPGKDSLGFLKYAPGATMAQVTASHGKVTITAGDMETSFTDVPSVDDFPSLPKVEENSEGTLKGDILVRTLSALSPYAAADAAARPVLSGVYLALGDEIEAVAADGFRLAWRKLPGRLSGPSMIIPLKGVAILEHLWARAATPDFSGVHDVASLVTAPRLIRLRWGNKYLKLNFDAVTLIICLIAGSFPDYHQLIPTETKPPVTVDAEDMMRALSQVAPVAKDNKGIVRLLWEGEKLQVSAVGDDREITVPIRAQFTEPGNTAIDIKYLREYFKGLSGRVSLRTESSKTPILFAYNGRPNTVVMPMFVDGVAKAEVKEEIEAEDPVDDLGEEPAEDPVKEPVVDLVEEPKKKKVKKEVKK